jgi:NitT/TauT family transport system substrate-binding protein
MKKILWLLLAFVMLFTLGACADTAGGPSAPSSSAADSPEPSPVTDKLAVRAGFLKGPTGIGAAYLMDKSEKGEARLDYTFSVESDPSIMMSEIIAGNVDIAAVPTNAAATLYNKTKGGVQILAINTLSVLYILEKGDSVQSVADLKGKTIYATGQGANPEYVLNYILRQSGLEPGEDVTIEFADGGEIAAKMASGDIDLCMLPVPNTTSVLMKNKDVRVALNLGMLWSKMTAGGSLTQGCVVIRSDLENKDAVIVAFLDDYWESVLFMNDADHIDEAAQLTFKYEMVGSVDIAKAAIPDCNLVCIMGADNIYTIIKGYFDVLYAADPKALGGAIPDDGFYYGD